MVLSSGNLATTQSVIARLKMRARDEDGAAAARRHTGRAARCSRRRSSWARRCAKWSARRRRCSSRAWTSTASFIVGGQIEQQDGRGSSTSTPRATSSRRRSDTNYFQIGEHKYGKPIIDRVVKFHDAAQGGGEGDHRVVRLDDALEPDGRAADRPPRLRDGTPASVTLQAPLRCRATGTSRSSRGIWSAGLRRAFGEVPEIEWGE